MFNTQIGKPIGLLGGNSKTKLYLLDPDDKKYKDQIDKIKNSKTKRSNIKCCRYHSLKCDRIECCNRCPYYYTSDSDDDIEDFGMKEFTTKLDISPLPDLENRFIEYIAGPSGSGKSTMATDLAHKYQKEFPKRKIFIFSRTDAKNDPAYKDLRFKQFKINDELINNPLDITKEVSKNGCLLIFDDCGTIHDEALKKEIEKLICDAMEVGRKLQVCLIITNHLVIPNERKFARTMMNELTNFTFFPKSGSGQQITYALKTYFGLSKKQIERLLQLDSRYVRISKGYPQYVQYAHGANIL
jgi:hypothetical protein